MTINVSDVIDESRINGFHIRVLGLCSALVFCDGFDMNGIGYAAPAIVPAFNISRAMLGPVFSAGVFGLTLGALAFGWLGDAFGRKRMFLLTGLMFGGFSLATVTAHSVEQLVLWRFLTGLGLGGGAPLAVTLASEYFPKRLRSPLVMVMFCAVTIGSVSSGIINAYFNFAGWRTVFVAGAVMPLAILPLLALWLPESAEYLALKSGDTRRLGAILARLNPRLSLAAGTRFILDEPSAKGFSVYALFRDDRAPRTILYWIMMAAALIGNYFFLNWLPTLLHGAGLSAGEIVQITIAFQIGAMVGTLVLARLAVTFGPFAVIAGSYFCGALAYLVLSSVGSTFAVMFAMNFFMGAFTIGTQSASNASSAILYPTGIRSTGVGWGLGIGRVGGTLGPSIAALLVGLGWPMAKLFAIAAVSPFIASCAAVGIAIVLRRAVKRPQPLSAT